MRRCAWAGSTPRLVDFDQAIRLRPDFAYAFYGRGKAYMVLEKPREAKADFIEALRLDPTLEAAKSQLTSVAKLEKNSAADRRR